MAVKRGALQAIQAIAQAAKKRQEMDFAEAQPAVHESKLVESGDFMKAAKARNKRILGTGLRRGGMMKMKGML